MPSKTATTPQIPEEPTLKSNTGNWIVLIIVGLALGFIIGTNGFFDPRPDWGPGTVVSPGNSFYMKFKAGNVQEFYLAGLYKDGPDIVSEHDLEIVSVGDSQYQVSDEFGVLFACFVAPSGQLNIVGTSEGQQFWTPPPPK